MKDNRTEILQHYRISQQEIDSSVEGQIIFADNHGLEKLPVSLFISNYCKNQQTVIDYDEDYGFFVIRAYPKAYGELEQPPALKTRAPYVLWGESSGPLYSHDLKEWVSALPDEN